MGNIVGGATSLVIGGVLAAVSIFGLIQSQTSTDGSPANVNSSTVQYGK